jgi:hypothetical protein
VRSEADKVALGQIFSRVLWFSSSLRISFHQCVTTAGGTNGRNLGALKKQHFFGNGENWLEKNLTPFYASKLDQGSLWISSILEQMLILYQNAPLY